MVWSLILCKQRFAATLPKGIQKQRPIIIIIPPVVVFGAKVGLGVAQPIVVTYLSLSTSE